ncbi:MFS transporter [Cohnella sp. WQ 127256]|uniref:MFS transporter n=1 Tax=Cohnella sp. WQ 127256 TaxID=2938790 RepID=UPI002118A99A|nr:MFS transporter [Cohnella sp. WQ 127256]
MMQMMQSIAKLKSLSKTQHRLLTLILVWCGIAVVSSVYITLPMTSLFAQAFQTTPELTAWTSSAFSLTYALGFLLLAPLSDRYGTKAMMLFGLVALTLVSPLIGLMDSLPGVITIRAVQGLVAASFVPNALTYIMETFPLEKRVATIGFISTGFLLAGIVGQVFSSLVVQSLSWSYVFYWLGIAYLLSAVLLGLFAPSGAHPRIRSTSASTSTNSFFLVYKQMGVLFRNKPLMFCYLIALTLFLTFVGMYAAIGSYLSYSPYELNSQQILSVRATGIVGMTLSLFTGKLVARFGMQRMVKVGLLVAITGLAAIGIQGNLTLLILSSIVYVAGISMIIPTLVSLAGTIAGNSRVAAMTIYSFILFLGATLGPLITLNLLKTTSFVITFESLALLLTISYCFSYFTKNPEQ